MSKKKIIILALAILVIIIAILFRVFSMASDGENKVEEVLALTDKQADIEKNFESEGYTIENPNVILNPYGNSPLTALVILKLMMRKK